MGVEFRIIKSVKTEKQEVHQCDGCPNVRIRHEDGYFTEDGWTYLHHSNRSKAPIVLCPACTERARVAVGWK